MAYYTPERRFEVLAYIADNKGTPHREVVQRLYPELTRAAHTSIINEIKRHDLRAQQRLERSPSASEIEAGRARYRYLLEYNAEEKNRKATKKIAPNANKETNAGYRIGKIPPPEPPEVFEPTPEARSWPNYAERTPIPEIAPTPVVAAAPLGDLAAAQNEITRLRRLLSERMAAETLPGTVEFWAAEVRSRQKMLDAERRAIDPRGTIITQYAGSLDRAFKAYSEAVKTAKAREGERRIGELRDPGALCRQMGELASVLAATCPADADALAVRLRAALDPR